MQLEKGIEYKKYGLEGQSKCGREKRLKDLQHYLYDCLTKPAYGMYYLPKREVKEGEVEYS